MTGTPEFPDGVCGLLLLTAEGSTTVNAVPLCRIAAVSLTNVAFPNEIGFGPEPCGSCGCEAQCEAAVRAYLPAGTVGVTVLVAGQTVATGTVRGSAEGIILITDAEDVPVYVSTCKIDRIETTAAG